MSDLDDPTLWNMIHHGSASANAVSGGLALVAELRRERKRVATLEDGIRWEIVSTWDEESADRLRALLDVSPVQDDDTEDDYEAMIEDRVYGGRDRDNERARQADIGANLPTGFVDQLAEEADRE